MDTDVSTSGDGVNQPDLNPQTLEVGQRAIKDGKQAWGVFSSLFQASKEREDKNARIEELYTGVQPKDPKELEDSSRGWESNFPTLFMAGIIDRIFPNLVGAIDSAKYLTQASLNATEKEDGLEIDANKKTEYFRELITKTVRGWSGWRNFVYSLCREVVLIGYAFGVWTDEDDPMPIFAKGDTLAVPDGSPQYSKGIQIFAFKQPMLVHEFVKIIRDRESADGSGWQIDECVLTANAAMPRDPNLDKTDSPRAYTDLIREGNTGASYMTGAKTIELGHLIAVEPETQKCSHFIIDRNATDRLLFQRFDRYESMEDVIVPVTLEPGNGKVYGSKGAGRMISNYNVAVDAAANDAVDQVRVGGMLVCKTDSKGGMEAQIRVRKPFIIINSDFTLEKEKLEADPEAFVALYTQLGKMAEIALGSYIPNLMSSEQIGGDKTAREATIDYNRELQAKAAFIIRFNGQFGAIMTTIQRRLCNPDSNDPTTKEVLKKLKEEGRFTEAEIKEIAAKPAAELAQDLSSVESQAKIAVYERFAGNPMVDQEKILNGCITGMTDPEYAEDVIIPDAVDPTIEAEQVRQQMVENIAIMNGASMPISPRDVHPIHNKVLIGDMQQAIPQIVQNIGDIAQNPEHLDHLNAGMAHGIAHANEWEKQGGPKPEIDKQRKFFDFVDTFIQEITKKIQKQKADQQQAQIAAQPPPEEAATPAGQGSEMAEKTLVAWIGQYELLEPMCRQRLEVIGGLRSPQEVTASAYTPPDPTQPPPEPDQPAAGPQATPPALPPPSPSPGSTPPPLSSAPEAA